MIPNNSIFVSHIFIIRNGIRSDETDLCLVGKRPKLSLCCFQPRHRKFSRSFQILTLQEGFSSLFFHFIFQIFLLIYVPFLKKKKFDIYILMSKGNLYCLIKCFSEDGCTHNTVKGVCVCFFFFFKKLFFWIILKVVSMMQFYKQRNKASFFVQLI